MKKILLGIVSAVVLGLGMMMPVIAENTNICDDATIDPELKEAAGCPDPSNPADRDKTIFPTVMNLINVVLAVVGILAVIVIIYGGVSYVISTGEASKVAKAKNIVLYGVVGLVVALLAYSIVYFVSAWVATPAP